MVKTIKVVQITRADCQSLCSIWEQSPQNNIFTLQELFIYTTSHISFSLKYSEKKTQEKMEKTEEKPYKIV